MKKENIKNWSQWLLKLSVSLSASLIILIVSLSITANNQHQIKKEAAKKVALVTLSNIDEVISNFEVVAMYYDDFINNYNLIISYKNINQVPDSVCEEFIDYIEGWDYFAINQSPENTFCTTFELWDLLDDIPLIRRIGNCYAYKDSFIEMYNRDQETIRNLGEKANIQRETNYHDKLKSIITIPELKNYMSRAESISKTYHNVIQMISDYNIQNKKELKVSDEDLYQLVAPKHFATDESEDFIFFVGPDM